jgi:hypothetical protein
MPTVVEALFEDLCAVLLEVRDGARVIVGFDGDVLDADMLLMVLVGDDRRHVELHAVEVELAAALLSEAASPLQFSDHQLGQGRAFYEQACGLELEGIVSKQADAPYAPGNRGLWLKVKCLNSEEFVVVGWTDPEGTRPFLGALLLAYYDPDGQLIYAGRAGTGIGHAELDRLWRRLQPLATPRMPLDKPPPRDSRFGSPLTLSRVHWVRPELVAEVKYLTWTEDNLLRQVVYEGCARTSPLPTSAVRYRTRSQHDEPTRAIPARRSAARAAAACIAKGRASQIRTAAAGRPYRALRRYRLYPRLDCGGRALSLPPAAGDALDADPPSRRVRHRQKLAPA